MSTTALSHAAATSTWKIDPVHSSAQFKVKHMMISHVKGEFTSISGTLNLDESDITRSRIEASIDASTITTRDDQRDAHLKSADFFHTEKFPSLSFHSTSVVQDVNGPLNIEGNLTIRGVTRTARFSIDTPGAPVKDPWGNLRIGFSATTRINRKDFGLQWNTALEAGGFLVGDEVTITVDAQFIKAL